MNSKDSNDHGSRLEYRSPGDQEFIERYLNYTDGKVDIGGWLVPQYIFLISNLIAVIVSMVMILQSPLFGLVRLIQGVLILLGIALLGFILLILDHSKKRKKSTIKLIKIYYGVNILVGLLSVNNGTVGRYIGLVISIVWLIYFFVSKRVKYTYTE